MKNKQIAVLFTYFFVVMSRCMQASSSEESMKLQNNISSSNVLQEKKLSVEEEIVDYSDAAFQSFVTCWSYKQAEICKKNEDENLVQDFYEQLPEDIQNTPWMQRCCKKNLERLRPTESSLSLRSMSSITDENVSQSDHTQSSDTYIEEYDLVDQHNVIDKNMSCDMKNIEMQDCMKTPVVCTKKNSKSNQQLTLQAQQEAQKLAKKAKEKLRYNAKKARRKAAKLEQQEKHDAENLFLEETACVAALQSKIKKFDEKCMHEKEREVKIALLKFKLEELIEDLLFTMIEDLEIEDGGYHAFDDQDFLCQYNELHTLLKQLKNLDGQINSSISLYLETLDKKIKKGMQVFDNDDTELDYNFYYDNDKKFTIVKNVLKITKTS